MLGGGAQLHVGVVPIRSEPKELQGLVGVRLPSQPDLVGMNMSSVLPLRSVSCLIDRYHDVL